VDWTTLWTTIVNNDTHQTNIKFFANWEKCKKENQKEVRAFRKAIKALNRSFWDDEVHMGKREKGKRQFDMLMHMSETTFEEAMKPGGKSFLKTLDVMSLHISCRLCSLPCFTRQCWKAIPLLLSTNPGFYLAYLIKVETASKTDKRQLLSFPGQLFFGRLRSSPDHEAPSRAMSHQMEEMGTVGWKAVQCLGTAESVAFALEKIKNSGHQEQ